MWNGRSVLDFFAWIVAASTNFGVPWWNLSPNNLCCDFKLCAMKCSLTLWCLLCPKPPKTLPHPPQPLPLLSPTPLPHPIPYPISSCSFSLCFCLSLSLSVCLSLIVSHPHSPSPLLSKKANVRVLRIQNWCMLTALQYWELNSLTHECILTPQAHTHTHTHTHPHTHTPTHTHTHTHTQRKLYGLVSWNTHYQ